MVETDVPRDLLDLKIRHISFATHPDPLSSATDALWRAALVCIAGLRRDHAHRSSPHLMRVKRMS
jgi:hypothetical protein